jgi:Tfp pilus assembly protein PilN
MGLLTDILMHCRRWIAAAIPVSDVVSAVQRKIDCELIVANNGVQLLKNSRSVESDILGFDQLDALGQELKRGNKLLVSAHYTTSYQHVLQVPFNDIQSARQALDLEIQRLLPFPNSDLFKFQWFTGDGKSQRVAHQAVVRPDTLSDVLSVLASRDATVEAFGFRDVNDTLVPAFLTRSGGSYVAAKERPWRMVSVASAALCLACCVGAWMYMSSSFKALKGELQSQVEALSAQAKTVRATIDGNIAEAKNLEAVFALRRKAPSVTDVWNELSVLLPDGSWVQQLSYAEGFFAIEGVSNNAEALVPLLEASKKFRDVSFSAAVTQSQGEAGQRFAIRFVLEDQP